jgi:hypothetical protein
MHTPLLHPYWHVWTVIGMPVELETIELPEQ